MKTGTERSREGWVLAATILASSMAFIDGTALNVAMPSIQAEFRASGADLLWVLNSYLVMLAALILLGGSLGDRFGRKRIFAAGIALFTAASCACGLAPSLGLLIGSRVLQGIGGALMIPGSLSIISASVAPERRGEAIGTWSAVTTLVTIAGPLLGGFLADQGLWRAVFLINLPLGIASLLILRSRVAESRDETLRGRVDGPGAGLAALALGAIAYASIAAPERGLGDPRSALILAVGIVAALAFILVELRSASPMLPLSLFGSRRFGGANLLTLFLYGALGVATFFISLDLIQVQGYSKTQAGMAFLPFALLLTLLSRGAGRLADRIGPRPLLILGPALSGASFFLIAFAGLTAGPAAYAQRFLPGMVLLGLGMGLTVAPLSSTVMGSVGSARSGIASGVNNAVARSASVLAIAIIGALALSVFGMQLRKAALSLDLGESARRALLDQVRNFGGATLPPQLSAPDRLSATAALRSSFGAAFRLTMLISAALAWLSALSAAFLIGGKREGAESP